MLDGATIDTSLICLEKKTLELLQFYMKDNYDRHDHLKKFYGICQGLADEFKLSSNNSYKDLPSQSPSNNDRLRSSERKRFAERNMNQVYNSTDNFYNKVNNKSMEKLHEKYFLGKEVSGFGYSKICTNNNHVKKNDGKQNRSTVMQGYSSYSNKDGSIGHETPEFYANKVGSGL